MSDPQLDVLYEDNHLLVVNKRAGLPTMGVAEGRPSLLAEAKQYVKRKYDKPGNVYLGIVSRLDAPVSGVVVIARTSKAAARLSAQFREQTVEKVYWAVVSGSPRPPSNHLVDWLAPDERHRRVHVVAAGSAGAREARLRYQTEAQQERATLLEVRPETGRKHQIRVQLAEAGHPVVGDRKYGSRTPFPDGIALHARRLGLEHPVRGDRIEFVAPLPSAWRKAGWRLER